MLVFLTVVSHYPTSNQVNIARAMQKYPCEDCDYKFTKKVGLAKHHQSLHMGKKYPCKECDYKFTQKGNLTRHQKSVHMGKKYPCEECGYQAKQKSEISV